MTPARLQCLTAISEWSDHWQLKLSPTKCSVLHVAPSNVNIACNNCVYHIGNVALPTVNSVTITYNNSCITYKLSFSTPIDNIVSKAALRTNLILSCFRSRNPDLLMGAFCAFVRPTLEYCSVIWSPMFQNQIDKIERVQRQFTKRLTGLHKLSYKNRLGQLGLESLCICIKFDLIMCYSILNNLVDIDSDAYFKRSKVHHTREA